MLPVGTVLSAEEGLIYKFKHYRIPILYSYPFRKGRPSEDELELYSQKYGFQYSEERTKLFENDRDFSKPDTKGGKTVCEIWKNKEKVAEGVAYCSYSDNFCYRRGRAIALGRALKELNTK